MQIPKHMLFLDPFHFLSDAALLSMRLGVGMFLVWGVWDNIVDSDRMNEFVLFLSSKGFAFPEFMARLSVWTQFFCGLAFITGLFSRWGGLLCALNFTIALIMVDAAGGIRSAFPAAMLVFFGLFIGTHGSGRYALDAHFDGRPPPTGDDPTRQG